MNIFVLDESIEKCARYHCDQHVVKMILESVQILCSALHIHGYTPPYKPTHLSHPCVLWAAASYDNYKWLKKLTIVLNKEYKYRFLKTYDHKSIAVLAQLEGMIYIEKGLTPFAQAMPEKYRNPADAVAAYRAYYVGEKLKFARWRRRRRPYWLRNGN